GEDSIRQDDIPLLAPELTKAYVAARSVESDRAEVESLVGKQAWHLARHYRLIRPGSVSVAHGGLFEDAATHFRSQWADAPRQFLEWIVATADPRVSAKTLSTLGAEPTIYSGDARVRGPYTREGWITQVGPQIRALARITARDTVLRFAIGSAPSIEDSL